MSFHASPAHDRRGSEILNLTPPSATLVVALGTLASLLAEPMVVTLPRTLLLDY